MRAPEILPVLAQQRCNSQRRSRAPSSLPSSLLAVKQHRFSFVLVFDAAGSASLSHTHTHIHTLFILEKIRPWHLHLSFVYTQCWTPLWYISDTADGSDQSERIYIIECKNDPCEWLCSASWGKEGEATAREGRKGGIKIERMMERTEGNKCAMDKTGERERGGRGRREKFGT